MKTLQMVFGTDFNKNFLLNVTNPKENLTSSEVQQVMNEIVAKSYLETRHGKPVNVKSARIVERSESDLFKL